MNALGAVGLELAILGCAVIILLIAPLIRAGHGRLLGYGGATVGGLVLASSFVVSWPGRQVFFGETYLVDGLAIFFKRLFLLTGCFVLVAGASARKRPMAGGEFPALVLIALVGMMIASSAGNLVVLFVSMELVTVAFYVLVTFDRDSPFYLETGVKFLLVGAITSAFLVMGLALVYGVCGTMSLEKLGIAEIKPEDKRLFQVGLVLVYVGLAFKLGAVPSQMWAPDVYQGAPSVVGAFLAGGSKAVGLVLLIRFANATSHLAASLWETLLGVSAGASILYGALCAIPQRNLKRLLGYSSIVTAGYLLVGLAMGGNAGTSAALYYMIAYALGVGCVFGVAAVVLGSDARDEFDQLVGLHKRSPYLAGVLAFGVTSLAGIPPMAGFFGKFLLLKSGIGSASDKPGLAGLVGIMILGIVISIYYYFNLLRVVYWTSPPKETEPIRVSWPMIVALGAMVCGIVWLGIFPAWMLRVTLSAAVASVGSAVSGP